MSKIKIGYLNRVDGATVAAGSVASGLPVANVQTRELDQRWRTDAETASYVTIDLGSPQSVDALGLFGINLSAAATIQIRASNTDFTTGDLLDVSAWSAPPDSRYDAGLVLFSATVTARYWRIDVSDGSLAYLEVGAVFLGPLWTPERNYRRGDKDLGYVDPSAVDGSGRAGKIYINAGTPYRVLNFTLPRLTEAEVYGQVLELDRLRGLRKPVLVVLDADDATYLLERSIWGLIDRLLAPRLAKHNSYSRTFRIRELV